MNYYTEPIFCNKLKSDKYCGSFCISNLGTHTYVLGVVVQLSERSNRAQRTDKYCAP